MEHSEELDQLFNAIDGFHEKSNLVKATKENPFLKNKYADFNSVVSSTKKDLFENGLRVKQAVTTIYGKTAIWTRLTHIESKQYMATVSPVAHKETDPQSQGSGITYMKRYAYIAILDLLVDTDDDGNLAAGLGKVAEQNAEVEKAIKDFQKATSEEELRKSFGSLNKDLMLDKRVIAAKDERKKELDL
jgi:hypothetical protein